MSGIGNVTYTMLTDKMLTRDRVCDEALGFCSKPVILEIDIHQAVDAILADKPESIKDDNFIDNLYAKIEKETHERKVIKAAHITDVHIDMEYKAGTNIECKSALCCREESGYPKSGETGARQWGEY